ncbi:MAG TPA: NAD(P)-dependent oxidoreductase, partial [Usitatibacter sp.]|nr:NAD(P)-dependent oxidoreductase [Usitatibacter sp.]
LEAGAAWAPTLATLVEESTVVITFLLDNAAVADVYLRDGGLLSASARGRTFIDMSTVMPFTHHRIASAAALHGAAFVECPVSGSIATAQSGALVGFAAGDGSSFARVRGLLAQLCRRVEHVGPLGAGARMKLAANLLLIIFWQALGEALVVADFPRTDAARAIDLLADSNIGAAILRTRGPQVAAAIKAGASGPPAFDVDTMRKDLGYMFQEGNARGIPLPLVVRTLECFDRASREGMGALDSVAYPAYVLNQQAKAAPPVAGAIGDRGER